MASTEEEIKNIILKHNGARKQQMARELNLGLDYIDLVCRDLEGKGKIAFSDGSYFLTISKNNSHQKNSASAEFLGIPKMTEGFIEILERAGYKTIESLADAPIARLMQETKLELREAAGLINQARKALNKI